MNGKFDQKLSPAPAARLLDGVAFRAEQAIEQSLVDRGVRDRSEADDEIFVQFNTSLAVALGLNLASAYYEIFLRIRGLVREFELINGTEVHKGSIYFNAAVLCLHRNDFDGALHYFHAADSENQKTFEHPPAALFANEEIFARNVYNPIHMLIRQEEDEDPPCILAFVGSSLSNDQIDTALQTLPLPIQSSVIVCFFRYAVYRAFDEDNAGTGVLYHRLLADLSLLFESSLKDLVRARGAAPRSTLGSVLRNDLTARIIAEGHLSDEIKSCLDNHHWNCQSVADLNALLESRDAVGQIRSETVRLIALAKVFSLALSVRNQVSHDIDPANRLLLHTAEARSVARIMLFATLHSAYI